MTTHAAGGSDFLTVRDVARLCQIHEVTVRRHIRDGRLRAVRVGKSVRVRREDFERYVHPEAPQDQSGARPRFTPLRHDDPIFGLVGIANMPEAADVSNNKHAALADAYIAKE